MPLEVNWERTDQCYWHEIMKLDFSESCFQRLSGIFIIWHGGPNPKVLFIGQGDIPTQLDMLRHKMEYKKFIPIGLFVTWAKFNKEQWNGVHRFLNEKLRPVTTIDKIEDHQIYVNLPF